MTQIRMNRRDALLAVLSVGAGMAIARTALSASTGNALTKAVPSSGQKIPVIGVGTNNYNVADALTPQQWKEYWRPPLPVKKED